MDAAFFREPFFREKGETSRINKVVLKYRDKIDLDDVCASP
jgi:hypothetical protein